MPGWRLAAAQCAIKHRAQFQRMINQHIGAPMGRIVVRMNVAPADGGGAGAGGAAGFDIGVLGILPPNIAKTAGGPAIRGRITAGAGS